MRYPFALSSGFAVLLLVACSGAQPAGSSNGGAGGSVSEGGSGGAGGLSSGGGASGGAAGSGGAASGGTTGTTGVGGSGGAVLGGSVSSGGNVAGGSGGSAVAGSGGSGTGGARTGGSGAGGTTGKGGASGLATGGATGGVTSQGGAVGTGGRGTGGVAGGGTTTAGTGGATTVGTGGAVAGTGGANGTGGSTGTSAVKLVGFATLNGGTKGGLGGETVTATTFAQLKSYAESATTYIIMVQGTLSNGAAGGKVTVKSNKSIIGVGSTAFLSGIGLDINNANNIIVQNLKLTLVGTTTPSSINGGDVIGIAGTSKNIWIDHCEIYSEDPSVQTDKDMYDGLLDIKGQTGFITISWCYFHDHHKGGLVGASDDDLYADRKVTYHHNYYNKVKLRVPMYRGSVGHFFNNYIVGAEDATEIRANTCVRVERNYYEALHYSIYTPSDAPGKTERISNVEVSRTSRAYPSDCTADIPYPYSDVLTSSTNDVKTVVPQSAGVGKI